MLTVAREQPTPPQAVVIGAATGIGLELARHCAERGYDVVVVDDERRVYEAGPDLRDRGAETVKAVWADLATAEGIEKLLKLVGADEVDVLIVTHGRSCDPRTAGRTFSDIRGVVRKLSGMLQVVDALVPRMRERGCGRLLLADSYMPGGASACINALLDSSSLALRTELASTGVTVTRLMLLANGGGAGRGPANREDATSEHVTSTAPIARAALEGMLRGDIGVHEDQTRDGATH